MSQTRRLLLRQLDTAWALASYHREGLTTDECLWRPAAVGLHVDRDGQGHWRAGWPDHEGYGLGPPSIAWLTWHMTFWWSMALDHGFGEGRLTREAVLWPGDAASAVARIEDLQAQWRAGVEGLSEDDLAAVTRTRWPFTDRPFADVVAWANVELTKNASEIGYARFLYAVRDR